MLVNFDALLDNAKIWVYQSNRKFYTDEVPKIIRDLEKFLDQWKNNGNAIEASYLFKYDRFIILGVNPSNESLSVEAIDSSVAFILDLQAEFNVELLDKLNVCFKQGEFVQYKDLLTFKKLVKSKSITAKTIVFNNLINTKVELEDNWEIPISESWHNRFF